MNPRISRALFVCLMLVAVGGAPSSAQTPASTAAAISSRVPPEQYAELRFSNRPIVTFRASVVPRNPSERVDGAFRALTRMVDANTTGPVASRLLLGASVVTVAGVDVFAILPDDKADPDDDLAQLTDETVARLRLALEEAAETRAPRRLAFAALRSLGASALLLVVCWALVRLYRLLALQLIVQARARIEQSDIAREIRLVQSTHLLDVARGLLKLATTILAVAALYLWATYALQQFPVTRPWGEALGGYLVNTITTLGWSALLALPGLFTAAIIFLAARLANRILGLIFDAIAEGRIHSSVLNPVTVVPTRRLTMTLIWLFAAVVAYPYLPGSGTDAFKGVSIFVGLVVSLGSSGVVNQVMSGFMLTYAGALAPGDYVRIGDVEGTVTKLGILSTKVKTRRREEITIPNAVVIGGTTINYSRHVAEGVYVPTVVTIGYDAPWRQVEALLLQAADRTRGLRREPPALVLQTSLSDFYVEYTLLVCVDQPEQRVPTLAELHAKIQDAFNEARVQIMSPHYEADPGSPKLVPRDQWFAAPARPTDAQKPSTPPSRSGVA